MRLLIFFLVWCMWLSSDCQAVSRKTARRIATTSRTTTNTARTAGTRGTVARATVTRAASNNAAASSAAPSATASNTTIRRSTPASTAARAAATTSIVQTDTVHTPLYTGRIGVRSNVTTRVPTIRMATATSTSGASATSTSTAASTATDMDELAQITDFCKAQYTQCMDNFCNVLDDNQGRCSCSANLKNYEKTETALKQATEELQDVAQKIQYIGLSANEIDTLFSQTEAELRMQNTTDNTQLKNDLDRIKKLIVDVNGGKSTASDTGISMDLSGLLDFSIDSTGFNLSSLLGGGNQSTISNQRGETLYKTAAARCKASVLNTCASQGVDTSLITNAYDLEIDKQCIAYERGLKESNEQMSSTVRNAKSVLQKARLMVAQNKNSYDLRGCISALDSCMQDDYVCGSDYENCLDPTGQYIVNGEIVVGSLPGLAGGEYTSSKTAEPGLYQTWDYTGKSSTGATVTANAWNGGSLGAFIDANMLKTASEFTTTGNASMAGYLQRKIGYIDKEGIARGMCASVLNKCQNFSYYNGKSTKKQEYNPDNQVVREYLERAMIQIKAAQDTRLADYAEDCIADVSSCLSQNNYNRTGINYSYNTVYGDNNYSQIAIKACLPVINTCRSVTQHKKDLDNDVVAWLDEALGTSYTANGTAPDVPSVPGINDVRDDVSASELAQWRKEDVAACKSLENAVVSEKGTMCIIFGADASVSKEYLTVQAKQAVAKFGGIVVGGIDNKRSYSETFAKKPTVSAGMYLMRYGYYQSKKYCEALGGKLNFMLGGHDEAPQCNGVPVRNAEECNLLRTDAPAPYPFSLQSFYDADKGLCRFIVPGIFYYSREIPGECSQGAQLQESGDCIFPDSK